MSLFQLTEIATSEGHLKGRFGGVFLLRKAFVQLHDVTGLQMESWKDTDPELRHSQQLSISERQSLRV